MISYYNKCRIILSSGRALDEIQDIYACRTIVDDANLAPEELIKKCYTIMDQTIHFMASLGYFPCKAHNLKDTKFSKKDFNDDEIFIPQQSYLAEENKIYVKDYILNPKKNGYQSLHVSFRDQLGRCFEYQVRTYKMDHFAEFGIASHDAFKEEELKKHNLDPLTLDRSRINMSLYTYRYGRLYDYACLEDSSICLLRTYIGVK